MTNNQWETVQPNREMQIQTSHVISHPAPPRFTEIWKSDISKCCRNIEKWKLGLCQSKLAKGLWKATLPPSEANSGPSLWACNSAPNPSPKRSREDVHKETTAAFLMANLKTASMSINRRVDGSVVLFSHNKILWNSEDEHTRQISLTWYWD